MTDYIDRELLLAFHAKEREKAIKRGQLNDGADDYDLLMKCITEMKKEPLLHPMILTDTIPLMKSGFYKDRLKAEYYQATIRCKALQKILDKEKRDLLSFTLTCPIELLEKQFAVMKEYCDVLEERVELEINE